MVVSCGAGGGLKKDSGASDVFVPPNDAAFDSDAPSVCGPLDVTNYEPELMHPPNPAHAGACTSQQASDYAACQGGDTSKCTQFGSGQPAQACGACIETQKTDVKWGVVVFENSVGTINVEGCIDDALSQVPYEKSNAGPGSCGDLLHASYGCQDQACGACTGGAFTTCDEDTVTGGCSSYDHAVESSTGECKALLGDAAPPAVASCEPDLSIKDPTSQRADFLTRIAKYMCGN